MLNRVFKKAEMLIKCAVQHARYVVSFWHSQKGSKVVFIRCDC